jgi:hypothetical protein
MIEWLLIAHAAEEENVHRLIPPVSPAKTRTRGRVGPQYSAAPLALETGTTGTNEPALSDNLKSQTHSHCEGKSSCLGKGEKPPMPVAGRSTGRPYFQRVVPERNLNRNLKS